MEPKNNQVIDIAPDKIQPRTSAGMMSKPITPGFQNSGSGIAPTQPLNSLNFVSNSAGWGLTPSGEAQFNGNRRVSGHFTPVIRTKGLTIWVSDATSPNGTLTGGSGDICLGCDSGKMYVCASGTTWYAPA